MDLSFWNIYIILVAATVFLLGLFISYYLLAIKRFFNKNLSNGYNRIAQGFLLLCGLSAINVIGGLFEMLPVGKMILLSLVMLPSLSWALLLLYQGTRLLAKEAKRNPTKSEKPGGRKAASRGR